MYGMLGSQVDTEAVERPRSQAQPRHPLQLEFQPPADGRRSERISATPAPGRYGAKTEAIRMPEVMPDRPRNRWSPRNQAGWSAAALDLASSEGC